jgi:glycerophosphoryl diester phosphodiesterase
MYVIITSQQYSCSVERGGEKMKTKVYAHRGRKGNYPENSMLAFKKAIEVGVAGIELDIHMTKDGKLVVIHDATLDRTTTGTGYIKDHTLAEIREFSMGAKFTDFKHYHRSWNLEKIPTLAEALLLFKEYDLEVNIELKTYEVEYPGIETAMLEVIAQTGYETDKIVYSSFHVPTLLRIKQLDKLARIAWLLENHIPMPEDYIKTLGFEALHLDKKIVFSNPEYWKPFSKQLRIWTVNEEAHMNFLIELGVDAIMTDYPEIASKIIKR